MGTRWFQVDPTLLKIKCLYFSINVLVCSLHSYKAQYLMRTLGLTKAQVGYVYVMQSIMFGGSLVWSSLVDRRPSLNRPLSAISPLVYAVVTCLLLVKWPGAGFWWVLAVVSASYVMSSALFPLLDAQVMHMLAKYKQPEVHSPVPSSSTHPSPPSADASPPVNALPPVNAASLDLSSTQSERVELQDLKPTAVSSSDVKKQKMDDGSLKGKMLFSRQRMWGAVGVAMASWLAMLMNKQTKDRTGMFAVMVVFALLYSLQAVFFLNPHPTLRQHRPSSERGAISSDAGQHPIMRLFRKPLWFSFMLFILSAGYTRAAINIYLPYFLDVEIGLGDMGPPLAAAVRLLSEWGIYFCGHWFTQRFGHHGVLLISQLAGLLRILGYGHLDQRCKQWPRVGLYAVMSVLELLKGVNSGLIVVGATKLASEMAPPGCEHTAQGLLTGIFVGLASALAGLLSGLFLQYTASKSVASLFRWSGWLGLAVFLIFATHFYVSGVLFQRSVVGNGAEEKDTIPANNMSTDQLLAVDEEGGEEKPK
jgi:hypothetical protein